jgi:chromosome segregation ATPase
VANKKLQGEADAARKSAASVRQEAEDLRVQVQQLKSQSEELESDLALAEKQAAKYSELTKELQAEATDATHRADAAETQLKTLDQEVARLRKEVAAKTQAPPAAVADPAELTAARKTIAELEAKIKELEEAEQAGFGNSNMREEMLESELEQERELTADLQVASKTDENATRWTGERDQNAHFYFRGPSISLFFSPTLF